MNPLTSFLKAHFHAFKKDFYCACWYPELLHDKLNRQRNLDDAKQIRSILFQIHFIYWSLKNVIKKLYALRNSIQAQILARKEICFNLYAKLSTLKGPRSEPPSYFNVFLKWGENKFTCLLAFVFFVNFRFTRSYWAIKRCLILHVIYGRSQLNIFQADSYFNGRF